MARVTDRLEQNVPGPFFVDRSCIDCGTCPRIAPDLFGAGESFSFVKRRPETGGERLRALMARAVVCDFGSFRDVPPVRTLSRRLTCPPGLRRQDSRGELTWIAEPPRRDREDR